MLSPQPRICSPSRSPVKFSIPVPELDFSPHKEIQDQDFDSSEIPILPLNGSIPRITGKTLVDLLTGVYDEYFESLFIIDCRYGYEYDGGHIKGAENINSPQELTQAFFAQPCQHAAIVFHCEFSHNRGPQMASVFRSIDREMNKENYPSLLYPRVYILDGGYKRFYAEYSDFCDGGYTTMLDENHRINGDLVRSTTMFRENVDQMNKMHREALQNATNRSSKSYQFQSPVVSIGVLQSPMTSKMLNFLASPVNPRRI